MNTVPGLAYKYHTRLDMHASNEHFSLFSLFVNGEKSL